MKVSNKTKKKQKKKKKTLLNVILWAKEKDIQFNNPLERTFLTLASAPT